MTEDSVKNLISAAKTIVWFIFIFVTIAIGLVIANSYNLKDYAEESVENSLQKLTLDVETFKNHINDTLSNIITDADSKVDDKIVAAIEERLTDKEIDAYIDNYIEEKVEVKISSIVTREVDKFNSELQNVTLSIGKINTMYKGGLAWHIDEWEYIDSMRLYSNNLTIKKYAQAMFNHLTEQIELCPFEYDTQSASYKYFSQKYQDFENLNDNGKISLLIDELFQLKNVCKTRKYFYAINHIRQDYIETYSFAALRKKQ